MPKKSTALAAVIQVPIVELPSIEAIVKNSNLSLKDKRNMVLIALGKKRIKQKYPSVEARKKAQKERSKKRGEDKMKELAKHGLGPRPRGPKLSKVQKKEKRKARAKIRREFLKDMARQNPELAKKHGIDISRFRGT